MVIVLMEGCGLSFVVFNFVIFFVWMESLWMVLLDMNLFVLSLLCILGVSDFIDIVDYLCGYILLEDYFLCVG